MALQEFVVLDQFRVLRTAFSVPGVEETIRGRYKEDLPVKSVTLVQMQPRVVVNPYIALKRYSLRRHRTSEKGAQERI